MFSAFRGPLLWVVLDLILLHLLLLLLLLEATMVGVVLVSRSLHWLRHLVLHVHLDVAAERVSLQDLLLGHGYGWMLALESCYRHRLSLMKLLFSLRLRSFLLHCNLLLDASDLVTHIQRVVLHLLAHFEGLRRSLGVSLLYHLAYFDLCLRQIHHFKVTVDVKLMFV